MVLAPKAKKPLGFSPVSTSNPDTGWKPTSWRTVTKFKDENDLLQFVIANCWKWKGFTPLAAARGEVQPQDAQSFVSQLTDEQLGRLGRDTQLRAVKAALFKVADYAEVPAIAMIVHGDDDAGQRPFFALAQ